MTISLTKETVLSLKAPPWTHAVGEPHGCAEDSESSSAGVPGGKDIKQQTLHSIQINI